MSQPPKKGEIPEKVVHSYHDHANDEEEENPMQSHLAELSLYRPADQNFTARLHRLLSCAEREGISHIISWQPHGRAFLVRHKKDFEEQVLSRWFHQSSMSSFLRQLNLYGFMRLHKGADKGGYYHELFLRGKPTLCRRIERTRIKGKGARKAVHHESEPDFYKMTPLPSDSSADMRQASAAPPVAQPSQVTLAQNLPLLRGAGFGAQTEHQGSYHLALNQDNLWQNLEGHDETVSHISRLSSSATLPHAQHSLAIPVPASSNAVVSRPNQPASGTFGPDNSPYDRPSLDLSQGSSLAHFATMQHGIVGSDQSLHTGNQEWNISHTSASQDFDGARPAAALGPDLLSFSQTLSTQTPITSLSTAQPSMDSSNSHLWDALSISGLFEPTPFPQLPSHPPNQRTQQSPHQLAQERRSFQAGNPSTLNANLGERQVAAPWNQILQSASPTPRELSSHFQSHSSFPSSRIFQNASATNSREEGKEGRIEEGKDGRSHSNQADDGDDRNDDRNYNPYRF